MSDVFPLKVPYLTLRFHTPKEGDTTALTKLIERRVASSEGVPFEHHIYLQVGMPMDLSEAPFVTETWREGMTGLEREVYYLNGFMAGVPFDMAGEHAVRLQNDVVNAMYNFQFTTQIRVYIAPEMLSNDRLMSAFSQWLCDMVDEVSDIGGLAGVSGHPDCPRLPALSEKLDTSMPLRAFPGTKLSDTPLWYEAKGDGLVISNHLHHSYQRAVDMLTKTDDDRGWGLTDVAQSEHHGHSFSLNISYLLDNSLRVGHFVLTDEHQSVPVWYLDVDSQSHHMTISQLVGVPVIKTVSQWRDAVSRYHASGFFNADEELIWIDFLVMSAIEHAPGWVDSALNILREPRTATGPSIYRVMVHGELVMSGNFDIMMTYIEALISMPAGQDPLAEAVSLASHFSQDSSAQLPTH